LNHRLSEKVILFMSQVPRRSSRRPPWPPVLLVLLGVAVLALLAVPLLARSPVSPAPGPTATAAATTPPTAVAAPSETAPPPDTASPDSPTPPATEGGIDTPTAPPAVPSAAPSAPAAPFSPQGTLAALARDQVPRRDLYLLTQQLKARTTEPLPRTTGAGPRNLQVGATEVFNVGNNQDGSYYTVTATLRDITPHAYWWVSNDTDLDLDALRQSAQHFETQIYPTNVAAFGAPPDPGVDGDSHINILNTALIGAAGYFSAADMYTRAVNPYSNERKMIYAGVAPGTTSYEGLLAHEFQHMIHWNVHPNQNIWINEGMAELAMKINGYDTGGPESLFMSNPDVQLNNWSSPPNTAIPHYGAAYLFMNYLYDHYGPQIIHAIMAAPGADIDAIDEAFAALGKPDRFDTVFTNWALANWLDKTTTDSRYQYPHLQVEVESRATLAGAEANYNGRVDQQAADYVVLDGAAGGITTVTFQGEQTVPLIPARPHSGQGLWWSNRDDVSAASLTHSFDLRSVSRATLSYWTWYAIEDGYDYAYAEISTDGGQTWTTLRGAGTTSDNPNGNNLGQGYTGNSGGGETPAWVQEQIDLTPYAGKEVQVRFQYVTDDGLNLQGFAVDDIRIPEIGFQDDVEAPGANGWTAEGFVQVDPVLPQRFVVALIRYGPDGAPSVEMVPLDGQNRGQVALKGAQRAVLMVAPLAPATTQPGRYQLTVKKP
jgi:hypothetical protein